MDCVILTSYLCSFAHDCLIASRRARPPCEENTATNRNMSSNPRVSSIRSAFWCLSSALGCLDLIAFTGVEESATVGFVLILPRSPPSYPGADTVNTAYSAKNTSEAAAQTTATRASLSRMIGQEMLLWPFSSPLLCGRPAPLAPQNAHVQRRACALQLYPRSGVSSVRLAAPGPSSTR